MQSNPQREKENEYFARVEYERLKALAQKQAAEEEAKKKEALKKLHHMHCPKCGNDLAEIKYRDVAIDKCTVCEGIWLDSGKLETILKIEDTSLMKKILKVFQ